jgi:uncharacterized protein (TIGR00290 family)
MFQTPGNDFISILSKNLNIPLIEVDTKGEKESELEDLEKAILLAKKEYNIEAIVSGAIESIYQASRIQNICFKNKLFSINPLWKINEEEYLNYLIKFNFKVEIIGIFSYPFTKNLIGKRIDEKLISYLKDSNRRYKTSLIGEGGEFETFVVDSPLYKKELFIEYQDIICDSKNSCVGIIKNIIFNDKKEIKLNYNPISFNNLKNYFLNYSNLKENNSENILIISTIYEKNGIYDLEYLKPIIKILNNLNLGYEIIQIDEINKKDNYYFSSFNKIIISGTSFLDFSYLKKINNFDKIFNLNKKIFGICAGAQIIARKFDIPLKQKQKLGLERIKLLNLEKKMIETYELRNFGIEKSNKIEILGVDVLNEIEYFKLKEKEIYGALFHPEVRGDEILIDFLKK